MLEFKSALWARVRARLSLAVASLFLPPDGRKYLRRRSSFDDWQELNRFGDAARADLEAALSKREGLTPLISIVMPVYRPDLDHLRAAVSSVLSQVYQNWQLCICDDGSEDDGDGEGLAAELERLVQCDPRIAYTALPRNQGISAATNAAVGIATGQILLFLDQDDLLTPDCLAEFAIAFADNPYLQFAWSDSDKLNLEGKRGSPSFKPGWSPWLLLSYMYLGHAVAVRRDIFDQVGGLRSEFDGSQDYDLALRVAEVVRHVQHIPRILYHWRSLPGSTALRGGEKPGAIDAGLRAVSAALGRRGIEAGVVRPAWAEAAGLGLFDLQFTRCPASLSLIILLDSSGEIDISWLEEVVCGLPKTAEVVVVSSSETSIPVEHLSAVTWKVLRAEPGTARSDMLSFARGHITGDVIVGIESGIRPLTSNWLIQLCGYLCATGRGLVAPRLVTSAGKVAAAGFIAPGSAQKVQPAFSGLDTDRHGALYLARTAHECAVVSSTCFAISRSALQAIGDIPAGVTDAVALGAALSAKVLGTGGTVLTCNNVDVQIPLGLVGALTGAEVHAGEGDPWYNRNYSIHNQFVPTPRCPPIRQQEPIRLAVVSHNLDQEGAQSTLVDLLAGLKKSGKIDPFVISSRPGKLVRILEDLGIAVTIIPSPARRAGRQAVVDYIRHIAEAYRAGGAQVVLANTLESYAAVSAASALGLGSLWWQHEGGVWSKYFRHLRWPVKAIAYAAFGQAYKVIQVADATRRDWLPLAIRDNFEVIRHGIPPGRVSADIARWDRANARSELGLGPDECCVLLLGSVSARKGQIDAVDALAVLEPSEVPHLRVMVVGRFVDQKYRKKLEASFGRLPAAWQARISLHGEVPDTSLFYSAADVFLCCSRQESAPRAIVEAMSFCLPIVTTPVDGIPELVRPGKNALFFSPGNSVQLAKILKGLAHSPLERERLGQSGPDIVRQVSDYQGMVDQFGLVVGEAARLHHAPTSQSQFRRVF